MRDPVRIAPRRLWVEDLPIPVLHAADAPYLPQRQQALGYKTVRELTLQALWTIHFAGMRMLREQPSLRQDPDDPRIAVLAVRVPAIHVNDRETFGRFCVEAFVRPLLAADSIDGGPYDAPGPVTIGCGVSAGIRVRPWPLLWWSDVDGAAARVVHDPTMDPYDDRLAIEIVWLDVPVPRTADGRPDRGPLAATLAGLYERAGFAMEAQAPA